MKPAASAAFLERQPQPTRAVVVGQYQIPGPQSRQFCWVKTKAVMRVKDPLAGNNSPVSALGKKYIFRYIVDEILSPSLRRPKVNRPRHTTHLNMGRYSAMSAHLVNK